MKLVWDVNKYAIHLERDKKHILIRDEHGNSLRISKNDKNSLIVNMEGSFKSK